MKKEDKDKVLLWYPKCSTCQKAKKWLEANHISFEERHILEETPTEAELKKWIQQSKLESKKFFNTSGLKYRELNLKEKLQNLREEEKIKILASDGMLIKRPIWISRETVLVGFKEKEWEKLKHNENT